MQTYSILGGVLHPGNNPKQLQTIQTVHKRWRSPPSRRLRRWIFDTPLSEVMSFCCRKAQTDSQIRVRQLPLTPTTLTDTIIPVRRTPHPQRLHNHQEIDWFIGCRRHTFSHVVERKLVSQQQQDDKVIAAAPS